MRWEEHVASIKKWKMLIKFWSQTSREETFLEIYDMELHFNFFSLYSVDMDMN
jgi:hypothetical protein